MNWWHLLQALCQSISMYSFGIYILLTPYVYFFIGHKFDKLFKNPITCPLDIGFECFNRLYRAIIYAGFIAFPGQYKIRKDYYQQLGGYDLRGHASLLQVLISKIYILLIFTYIPTMLLVLVPGIH